MEWLKEFLGEELYATVAAKLNGNDKVKLANLAGGDYVAKAKFDAELSKVTDLTTQLTERSAQLSDLKKADPAALQARISELTAQNTETEKAWQKRLADKDRDYAMSEVLRSKYKALDVASVMPHLKQDAITYAEGTFTGLEEQMQAISKSKSFLFAKPETSPGTGGAPQGPGTEPPTDAWAGMSNSFSAIRKVPNE